MPAAPSASPISPAPMRLSIRPSITSSRRTRKSWTCCMPRPAPSISWPPPMETMRRLPTTLRTYWKISPRRILESVCISSLVSYMKNWSSPPPPTTILWRWRKRATPTKWSSTHGCTLPPTMTVRPPSAPRLWRSWTRCSRMRRTSLTVTRFTTQWRKSTALTRTPPNG